MLRYQNVKFPETGFSATSYSGPAPKAGHGNCMVRRRIASRIVVVGGWSAQMYPTCLWRQAPGHNGVRASLVYKDSRTQEVRISSQT